MRKGIRMPLPLILDYMSFAGQVRFPVQNPALQIHRISEPSCFTNGESDYLIQCLSPHFAPAELSLLLQPYPHTYLFLAGILFWADPRLSLVERIVKAIQRGEYTHLPEGNYCGCLVTPEKVWLWKTHASNDTIFYRRSGERFGWSTDPHFLVTGQDLSRDALARCCLGDDVFVYQSIEYVAAGTIVTIDATRTHVTMFDQIESLSLPKRITLPDLAASAREALIEATRPLAQIPQKIGILLSGGLDSAAVAAALVHHGADITAYHLQFGHPAADESAYAQAVCEALSLPLVIIPATTESDFLSLDRRFPHPYGHAGLRWMQLVAEHAMHDGISLLTTGRGGDPAFGPLDSYGLVDICAAPIPVSEKFKMFVGVISTDWLLPDVIKSLKRSHSLINERSLSAGSQDHFQAPPFLYRCLSCAPLQEPYEQTGFSPQDLVLETVIWQPHGLRLIHPYCQSAVQHVAKSIPAAYRLIPYRGMRVVKPVLRLAFADLLPPQILRQKKGGWLNIPSQEYCVTHIPDLLDLLGNERTQVGQLGILDQMALRKTLSSHQLTRKYAKELIATAMIELFLRQTERNPSSDAPRRGA